MFRTIKFSLFTAVACCVVVSQSYAGFQFTAPVEKHEQPQITMSGSNGNLLPIISSAPVAPVVRQPMQISPAAPQIITPNTPVQDTGMMSLSPAPIKPKANVPLGGEFDLAVGFGKDLPLITALRQVIPSNYTYVLEKDIPVGQTVSWSGGQAWPVVLNDMVSPYGMNADIQGGIVTIFASAISSVPAAKEPSQELLPVVVHHPEPIVPQITVNDGPQQIAPAINSRAVMPVAPQVVSNTTKIETLPIISDDKQETETQVPIPSKGQWMARNGNTLRGVLEAWSNIASVDLFWSSDYDYPLMGDVNISGNFEEAIEQLLGGFSQAKPKPVGRLHPNLPHGPAVLVVETRQMVN